MRPAVARARIATGGRGRAGTESVLRRASALAAFAAVLFLTAAPLDAQRVDPTESYRTIETANFRITYTTALEPLAQHAARVAERAHALLAEQIGPAPGGRIDLLLTDASDDTNGFATPLPSNRITIFVNPPVEELGLQKFSDWLDLVITHELAHIFHMDSTGKLGRFVRAVFGRIPVAWPVFPAASMPTWAIEGLAVEMESLTGEGRLHDSFHETVVRTAVLENAFEPIDRVNVTSAKWPGGQRAYIYGSLFLDYISRTYGVESRAHIIGKSGGTTLPPVYATDRIGKSAIGKSFTELWREWKDDLSRAYAPLFDSLRAAGVTPTERIAGSGRIARYPRVSPDGRFLAFAEESGRDVAHTRVIELDTRQTAWAQRRTGIAASGWMPDTVERYTVASTDTAAVRPAASSLLTSQIEFNGAYRTFADLYVQSKSGEERLTKGARVQDPDVDRTGTRIIAVQNDAGATRLVLLSRDGETLRAINGYDSDVQWSKPRWSPDGTHIAVGRWRNGHHDIVVIDTAGNEQIRFSDDAAVDEAPAWSPDGRYVLFWSDRSGIPNIYAVDVTQPPLILQVTDVLTGAYDPEVSPDGRYLYMSVYHADGFHIERTAYDPSTWRLAAPARVASFARVDCSPSGAGDDATVKAAGCAVAAPLPAVPVTKPRPYSPLRTLRPYYWLPLVYDVTAAGTFVGASTSGQDLVGRHAYSGQFAVDPVTGRTAGALTYTFTGIGPTAFGISLERDWDYLGIFSATSSEGTPIIVDGIEREDIAQATASFFHRRVRSAATLTVGAERIRRRRVIAGNASVRFTDPVDDLWGPIARFAFTNARLPAHAISPENGITLQVAGRKRFDLEEGASRGYTEVTTWNTAYQAIGFGGFAHHVIAARFSALFRDGPGASPSSVGGVPGAPVELGLAIVGNDAGLLPIRGFVEGDRFGTRAWTASLEYRIPLAFPARGFRLWPIFIDRLSATLFGDAGNASCPADIATVFACPDGPSLLSTGAELNADVAAGFAGLFRARAGVAQPISGPRSRPRAYVGLNLAF